MSKRKLVPKAQHAEYIQYASLLRSLRTNDILDVTSQLTQYHSDLKGKQRARMDEDEDDEYEDDLEDLEDLDETVAGPSSPSPSSSRQAIPGLRRKRSHHSISREGSLSSSRETSTTKGAPCKRKKKQCNQFSQVRDTWTRWPLLMEDVPVPDWGMEDEVEHLVNLLRRSTREEQNPGSQRPEISEEPQVDSEAAPSSLPSSQTIQTLNDDVDSDLDSLDSLDPPSFLPEFTLTATNLLHSTLAALAQFTPARAPSLQNRLEPIGWETVLDAFTFAFLHSGIGASDFQTNQRIVENVRKRMENVYGPSRPYPMTTDRLPPDVRIISIPREMRQTEGIDGHEQPSPQLLVKHRDSIVNLLSHRLEVAMKSRQRLAEALENYGASDSSLFDTKSLRTQNEKSGTSDASTSKRSTWSAAVKGAPKRGPSIVSSVASRGGRRTSTRRFTGRKGKKIKAQGRGREE